MNPKITAALALLVSGLVGFLGFRVQQTTREVEAMKEQQSADSKRISWLEKRQKANSWAIWLLENTREKSPIISPVVGMIQFTESGLSVMFEEVKYTSEGLYLKGLVGNTRAVTLSILTLSFDAYGPIWDNYERVVAAGTDGDFIEDVTPEVIASAQAKPIPRLDPGTQQRFEVTLPGIKQTKQTIYLSVSTSGERYTY